MRLTPLCQWCSLGNPPGLSGTLTDCVKSTLAKGTLTTRRRHELGGKDPHSIFAVPRVLYWDPAAATHRSDPRYMDQRPQRPCPTAFWPILSAGSLPIVCVPLASQKPWNHRGQKILVAASWGGGCCGRTRAQVRGIRSTRRHRHACRGGAGRVQGNLPPPCSLLLRFLPPGWRCRRQLQSPAICHHEPVCPPWHSAPGEVTEEVE